MSMKAQGNFAIPEETVRVARAAFPKGNPYMHLRDALGPVYADSTFASLFDPEGQPAVSPGQLAFVLVLQFAEGLSDRQAAEAVRSRIDWKYALGLALTDTGFDASVLSEFRQRLLAGGVVQQLLDDLLQRCQAQGWLKAGGKQRTDSTHVLAAVRILNRLELVGETLRQALEALSQEIPHWLQQHVPAEWYVRYGQRFEQYRLPKAQCEQRVWGELIGADGHWLLAALYQDAQVSWCLHLEAVRILRQVWLQQDQVEDEVVRWRQAGNLPPASLLIESPYDGEARLGQKRKQSWIGYKVHLPECCDDNLPHLLTQVMTTPAPVADITLTTAIQADLVARPLAPAVHLVDAGYVDAAALVHSQTHFASSLLGPVKADTSKQAKAGDGFSLAHFILDWEQQQATCPNGKTSRLWRQELDSGGIETIQIRFAKADCLACPLRTRCTSAQQGRSLRLRAKPDHEALQDARLAQTTPEFRQGYNARTGIEATFSQAKRAFGLWRSRYSGLAKTHLQNVLIALAVNLARLDNWFAHRPLAKTRISHFAALAPA